MVGITLLPRILVGVQPCSNIKDRSCQAVLCSFNILTPTRRFIDRISLWKLCVCVSSLQRRIQKCRRGWFMHHLEGDSDRQKGFLRLHSELVHGATRVDNLA